MASEDNGMEVVTVNGLHVKKRVPVGLGGAYKGVVLMCHGYMEHHGRYEELVEVILGEEWATVQHDWRGHGDSVGTRGDIQTFQHFLGDMEAVLKVATDLAESSTSKKVVIFAHSLGGLIVVRYLLSEKNKLPPSVAAIALSSPYLKMKVPLAPVTKVALNVLKTIAPATKLKLSIQWANDLCSNEEVNKARLTDTKGFRYATARWIVESSKAQAYVCANFEKLSPVPTYIFVATKDSVADPEAMLDMGKRSKNVTIFKYEGFRHEIALEPNTEVFLKDLKGILASVNPSGTD